MAKQAVWVEDGVGKRVSLGIDCAGRGLVAAFHLTSYVM